MMETEFKIPAVLINLEMLKVSSPIIKTFPVRAFVVVRLLLVFASQSLDYFFLNSICICNDLC